VVLYHEAAGALFAHLLGLGLSPVKGYTTPPNTRGNTQLTGNSASSLAADVTRQQQASAEVSEGDVCQVAGSRNILEGASGALHTARLALSPAHELLHSCAPGVAGNTHPQLALCQQIAQPLKLTTAVPDR
jgi:hypothetical protein